jgi:hypothetical protein
MQLPRSTPLKCLAGAWSGRVTTEPPNREIEGPIHVTMRVASRGNLLLHEMKSGGQPEPTLIFVENDRLTLVHYCDAGNRPRLVAPTSSDGKTMTFEFVDIFREQLAGIRGAYRVHYDRRGPSHGTLDICASRRSAAPRAFRSDPIPRAASAIRRANDACENAI